MTELKNVKSLLKISFSLLKGEIRESSGIYVKSANSSQPFWLAMALPSCQEKGLLINTL